MKEIQPIFGTTYEQTDKVLFLWFNTDPFTAGEYLKYVISINIPEAKNNTLQMAVDTIIAWVENNF